MCVCEPVCICRVFLFRRSFYVSFSVSLTLSSIIPQLMAIHLNQCMCVWLKLKRNRLEWEKVCVCWWWFLSCFFCFAIVSIGSRRKSWRIIFDFFVRMTYRRQFPRPMCSNQWEWARLVSLFSRSFVWSDDQSQNTWAISLLCCEWLFFSFDGKNYTLSFLHVFMCLFHWMVCINRIFWDDIVNLVHFIAILQQPRSKVDTCKIQTNSRPFLANSNKRKISIQSDETQLNIEVHTNLNTRTYVQL